MEPVPGTDARPRREIDPLIGTKIADKYLVKRRLATVSISDIYLVETDEKESFALHILKEIYRETEERQRFEKEVELLVQLDHNRIINPVDLGLHNYRPFFVTEYCEYGSLDAYWQENYPQLNQTYVLDILEQLGDAVQYLHSVGIVHGDVCPENILLRTPTDLVLTGFAVARRHDVAETTGDSAGADYPSTPWYMAPEQWLHQAITPATDQYAMALLAYLLLTGRHPIDGDLQFIRMTFEEATDYQPPALSSLNGNLNAAVDSVVLKALSRKPADRYQTIADFLTALEDALGHVEAGPATPTRQRRMTSPTVMLGLAVIAVIVLGIGLSGIASGLTTLTTTVATPSPIVQVVPTLVRSATPEPTSPPTSTPTASPPTATDAPTMDLQALVAQSLTSIVLSASPTSSPVPTTTPSATIAPSATPVPTATPLPTLTEILAGLLPGTPNQFDCGTYRENYTFLAAAVEQGATTYMPAARLFSFDDSTVNLIFSACNAAGNTQFARIDSTLYADLRFEINQLIALNSAN